MAVKMSPFVRLPSPARKALGELAARFSDRRKLSLGQAAAACIESVSRLPRSEQLAIIEGRDAKPTPIKQ